MALSEFQNTAAQITTAQAKVTAAQAVVASALTAQTTAVNALASIDSQIATANATLATAQTTLTAHLVAGTSTSADRTAVSDAQQLLTGLAAARVVAANNVSAAIAAYANATSYTLGSANGELATAQYRDAVAQYAAQVGPALALAANVRALSPGRLNVTGALGLIDPTQPFIGNNIRINADGSLSAA